jgi:hypothetical protein
LAAKNAIVVTATKIVDGKKQAVTYSGSGKDVTLMRENIKIIYPASTSDEDSVIVLVDGTMIYCPEEFDDLNTDVSATDITNS